MNIHALANEIILLDKTLSALVINSIDANRSLQEISDSLKNGMNLLRIKIHKLNGSIKKSDDKHQDILSIHECSIINSAMTRWNSFLSYIGRPAFFTYNINSSCTNVLNPNTGIVISISGNKTIKVSTSRIIKDSTYKKYISREKSYLVHDEINQCIPGDRVLISETRRLSAKKYHKLILIEKKYPRIPYRLDDNSPIPQQLDYTESVPVEQHLTSCHL